MLRLRDQLPIVDRVRYAAWRAIGRRPLTVRLTSGERIILRPPPSSDLAMANELFVQDCYRSPSPLDADSVRLVVDLGANVGYGVVRWLRWFPHARVVAFEPHPVHCEQIRRHLAINPGAERVELVEAAAGASDRTALLSDNGGQSTMLGVKEGVKVAVRDVFARLAGRAVDFLKIDVEGAEYEILGDPRMAQVRPRQIALEWHAAGAAEWGPEWCDRRLAELGYDTVHMTRLQTHGTLWAFPRDRDAGPTRRSDPG